MHPRTLRPAATTGNGTLPAGGSGWTAYMGRAATESGYLQLEFIPNAGDDAFTLQLQARITPAHDFVTVKSWTEADTGRDGATQIIDPVPILPHYQIVVSGMHADSALHVSLME